MNRRTGILLAAILGSGVVFLDSSVVVLAQQAIARELPATLVSRLEGLSYVYYGYLLTLSALLILAGALNDYYGRRRMFLIGLVGFAVTSALCGLAPNLETLVVARLAQGVAGAILVPGSLSILTAGFRGEEQSRAFGIWAGASGATSVIGPLVGGLLVNFASWRLAFLINVPLVAIAVWATLRHVPESRDETATGHFDWLGAAVIALAVGGLSFGVIRGQARDWSDPVAFAALAIGALCAVAFPVLMARRRYPLVPLELFRSRNFSVTNLSTLVIYGALYVTFQYQALFVIGVLGYDELAYTVATVPGSLFLVLLSTRFGALAARHGARRYMALGPLVMAAGLLWLARIPADSASWRLRPALEALARGDAGEALSALVPPVAVLVDFLPATLLFGAGLTILVAPLTTALMTSVPVRNSGVASAINNALSRVGPQLLGAIIFVAITASYWATMAARLPALDTNDRAVRGSLSPLTPPGEEVARDQALAAREASTDAFHLAMAVSAAFLVAGALVNYFGIEDRTTRPAKAAGAAEAARSS